MLYDVVVFYVILYGETCIQYALARDYAVTMQQDRRARFQHPRQIGHVKFDDRKIAEVRNSTRV